MLRTILHDIKIFQLTDVVCVRCRSSEPTNATNASDAQVTLQSRQTSQS